jgi:hypothetical protein
MNILPPDGFGSSDPPTGNYSYTGGSTFSAQATPSVGWEFSHWLEDGTNVKNSHIWINDYSNHTLRAFFVSSTGFDLTLHTVGSGGSYIFWSNSSVTGVKCEPQPGWIFEHWDLDGVNVGSSMTYNVTMDRSHVLTAVFIQPSVNSNTNSIPAYPFEAVVLGIICFFLIHNRFRK